MRPRFLPPYGDGVAVFFPREQRVREPDPARPAFAESVRFALSGLRYAVTTQRNVRIQLGIGACAVLLALVLRLPGYELALVLALTALVLCAELMNTALEMLVNHLAGTAFDPSVKRIKDLAAGSVLVVCLGAAVVGAAVFLPHLSPAALGRVVPDRLALVCAGLALLGVAAAYVAHRHEGTRGPARVTAGVALASSLFLVLVRVLAH